MVKVSIIVPIFNTSKYLKRCIDSLINQTLEDIEIILINDGSTDETHNIVKSYSDPRIKYYKRKNYGIASTRNFGISNSTGEYISFVDSDDYLNNTFCEEMYNKAIKDNLDMCICNYYNYFENKQEIKRVDIISFPITSLDVTPNLFKDINLSSCNKIYKRNMFDSDKLLFPDVQKFEDIAFVTSALNIAKRIGKLDLPLYYFLVHDGSVLDTVDDKTFELFKVLDIVYNEFKNNINVRKYLSYLIVDEITTYIVKQKYQQNKILKNKFIDDGYEYLKTHIKNYRKHSYFKNINIFKALVEKNKLLTKLYCNM